MLGIAISSPCCKKGCNLDVVEITSSEAGPEGSDDVMDVANWNSKTGSGFSSISSLR